MKTKAFITICLFFTCSLLFGQNKTTQRLQGSWLGKIIVPNGPKITTLMHFKVIAKALSGTFDSPDQSHIDLLMDSVWMVKDSIFADFSSQLGPGTGYKGVFLGGDSVIDGHWIQGGGSYALKLKPSTYEYVQKVNLNPQLNGYKIIKLIKSTPIKDQHNTGTCWSFATTSFIETEAIRLGKKPVPLSPMFFVTPTFLDKAERYIRLQGNQSFNEGGLTFHALKVYRNFGAIPEEVYSGKYDPAVQFNHLKMEHESTDKIKAYVDRGYGKMTADEYKKSIAEIVYKTIPKAPESFVFEGKRYTPQSFAAEKVGINPDNYVEITSYTHHPFYAKFALEMPSNWNNDEYLNVPLTDFISIVDHALLNNYSVAWDGDIQEGYKDGYCKLADGKVVTQQSRQAAFDDYTTQDNHNMHIIGLAENKDGKRFYILKNSSAYNDNGGYIYMSKEYLQLKTI
ncbi:MAG: Bleomycin hydrolase, partial [Pedobacter sp.]|nr:Bleomycin hydrolase [Pedobacter sp.]